MVKNAALVGCALSVALALIVALVAPVPALALPALPVPGAAGGHPGAYMAVQGSNAGAENSHLRIRVFWGPPTLLRRAGAASLDASPRAYVYDGTSILVLIDQHLARVVGGAVHTYVPDALGTVRAVTDGARQVENTYAYRAYGELRSRTGAEVNPYLFTGRALDQNTGDYFYRSRYYDPALGRFLGVDPYAPQQETFAYAFANPHRWRDPLGLATRLVGIFEPGTDRPIIAVSFDEWGWYADVYSLGPDGTRFQTLDLLGRAGWDALGFILGAGAGGGGATLGSGGTLLLALPVTATVGGVLGAGAVHVALGPLPSQRSPTNLQFSQSGQPGGGDPCETGGGPNGGGPFERENPLADFPKDVKPSLTDAVRAARAKGKLVGWEPGEITGLEEPSAANREFLERWSDGPWKKVYRRARDAARDARDGHYFWNERTGEVFDLDEVQKGRGR